ncbi:DUF485 domain-containing protein [Streptomyces sp. NPDC048290]|uniref:DUF485 domain-containing protein n=1 Tax=Streptomyces sp. NPDC048290 TaxID=3155811 RepID=UPI0034154215
MSYDPLPQHDPPFPPRPPHSPYTPPPSHNDYFWQPEQPGRPEEPPIPPIPPIPAASYGLPTHAPLGQHSDLRVLRGAYRIQRRTATFTALGYFTFFLFLSAGAPSVMGWTLTDGLPLGMLLALAQLPVTWLATALYEQTARRHVDPIAERLRRQADIDARREGGAR